MRFSFVDRIVDLQPGVSITTVKTLHAEEEYLRDHFPRFAVMPGVLMLEAMTQSGAWLIRASEDFAHSLVLLKEARNVRYKDFVQPGQVLTTTLRWLRGSERETQFEAQGTVDDKPAVSARLVLERSNLSDARPEMAHVDRYTRRRLREDFAEIYAPAG